jgi:hypothetical protein
MKKSRLIWGLGVVVALGVVVYLLRGRIHFDVRSFGEQMARADLRRLAAGVALILFCFWLRAVRWALFLQPLRASAGLAPLRGSGLDVLPAQFIGFTSVGLFGKLADPRPYLIAKRTQLSVSSQIAVFTVERMFDLGAAALIFSTAVAFMSKSPAMPHAEVIARLGRGSLLGTMLLAIFAVALWVTGERVAQGAERLLQPLNARVAAGVANRIRGFRVGLRVVTGVGEFACAMALSLAMWGLIALAYVQCEHAFVGTPQLAQMSFGQTMLLLASNVAGSVVQLPVVGWFSQIAVTAGVLTGLFGVGKETATACGAVIYLVTSLSVIPVGVVCARIEHVSLKKMAE